MSKANLLPKLTASDRNASAILRAVRKAERESSGSGFTILKQRSSPIRRLLDKGRIGPGELAAAGEVALAFQALAGELMLRPVALERRDRSNASREPAAVIDAVSRYQVWAKLWSVRARRGDPTLEIVIAAVIDEQSLRELDLRLRLRNGRAAAALIAGLRDYAARAGWISHGGVVECGGVFRLRPLNELRELARKWDSEARASDPELVPA